MAAAVIGVIGASGGLGSSTLAAALTRRVSVRQGACVLVDLDLAGGGAEVTTAVEHREGVRWVDLRDVVGSVDATRLVEALPGVEGAGVLSAGGRGPVRRADVPLAACRDVLDSLLGGDIPVVLDLPRSFPAVEEVAAQCSELALVTGLHTRALADLDSVVDGSATWTDLLTFVAPASNSGSKLAVVTAYRRMRVNVTAFTSGSVDGVLIA